MRENLENGKDIKVPRSLSDRQKYPFIPAFVDCVTLPQNGGEYFVVVRTLVDQSWKDPKTNEVPKDLPPQSHFVNLRTNPDWHVRNADHVVQGKKYFYSKPLKVTTPSNCPHKSASHLGPFLVEQD